MGETEDRNFGRYTRRYNRWNRKESTGCSEMKEQGVRTEAILEVTGRMFLTRLKQ